MATIARWLLLVLVVAISACSSANPTVHSVGDPSVEDLRERAEKGDPAAQWRLGSRYDTGHGVPRDGAEAEKWYRRSAESGYAEAQNSLGSVYQAEHRYKDAVVWYQKAADQGHPLALNNLAYMYDLGLGLAQDRRRAFDLYTKAANQGNPQSMLNIAIVYGSGQIGDKDVEQAYIWLLRAKRYRTNCFAHDSQLDDGRVDRLIRYSEGKLSLKEQEQARRISADWSPAGKCK
jgi:tetratricopeptide (TPR) repeat protein